jgi:hypothetical protein
MSTESRDNYCFICGHYLAEANVLNSKNKKFYAGEHISGNQFSKSSVENQNNKIIHNYNPENEILFHPECYEVLSKKCKYKLKWKDVAENIEAPNAHTLVPYLDIERPPDVNKIKKEHKWSEEQIIEEWEPVIDEIRTKNVEEKKEKKEKLQLKRELRREQLRKQRDKKMEKIEGMKLKIEKLEVQLKNEETNLENKETILQTIQSASKRTKTEAAIEKCRDKINKKQESIDKENDKLNELKIEYDLFLKAWF